MTALAIPAHTVDELLDTIVEETLRIRYAWGNYRQLFVEKTDNVRVLNATASDFFGWVQQLAADAVFMGISRLTDRAVVAGQPTASLARLLSCTTWETTDPALWQRYSTELTAVETVCLPCRKYRHKRLGHFDLAIALRVQPVPVVTVREVDEALDAIERFVGSMYTQLRPNHSHSFRFLNAEDHVNRLLKKLTNRVSKARQDAICTIIRKDETDAALHCPFCGEAVKVYLFSDAIPHARYLRLWHFDQCHGVAGFEQITVEMHDVRGELQQRTFALDSD